MSDFMLFIFILFFGFMVSMLIYFILCFPSFSPASRHRALRLSYYIMIPFVLIAFLSSHMVEHVFHFLDFIANNI